MSTTRARLSHVPVDILKDVFRWIQPKSIDACMLRQSCAAIKWVLVNQMGWEPTINTNVSFRHNLGQIQQFLPVLDANSCDSLKMTCLRGAESLNFRHLHGEAPILLEHITLIAEYGHLDCLDYLLSNWDVRLTNLGWQSLLDVATRNGHLAIAKWYFSKLVEYTLMEPEYVALPDMQQFITRFVTHESYHDRAIVLASEYGHLDLVKYYHSLGANPIVNANDAIQRACSNGHLNVVKYLHSNGADVRVEDGACIFSACKNGHLQVVEFLHSVGADVHVGDDGPFRIASRFGHLNVLQYLFANEFFEDVDSLLGESLLKASSSGHLKVTRYLLSIGANIHFRKDQAFQMACAKGHLKVVQYLYSNGADYQSDEWLALRNAAKYGRLDVVQFLVSIGADMHVSNDEAIQLASTHGQLEVIQYLYAKGANIHAVHDAALRFASNNGHFDVVVYLHSVGAKVNALSNEAFRSAAFKGHLEIVKFLHSVGGSSKVDIEYGLNVAVSTCHEKLVVFLLSIGADLHSLTEDYRNRPKSLALLQWLTLE